MREPITESCDCKLGRNIDRYGLDTLNEELLRQRRENELSLRDLADYVNQRLLEAELATASEDLLGESSTLYGALDDDEAISSLYDALFDEDVSPDRRARVRTRLSQAGVDLDRIEPHQVTHTTVHRHLRECLGVDTSEERRIEVDDANRTIEWIRSRCTAIVDRTFERLARSGKLDVGTLDISVSIRVTCTDCGATFSPSKLLSRGRCDCSAEGDPP